MYYMEDTQKKDENGIPLEGEQYAVLEGVFDKTRIGVITRWKNGYLHADLPTPAVECEDLHREYWLHGKLAQMQKDNEGELVPAILTSDMIMDTYWIEEILI